MTYGIAGAGATRGPGEEQPTDAALAATVDALLAYLEVLTREWATTPEQERLEAVHLARSTAKQVQHLLERHRKGADRV